MVRPDGRREPVRTPTRSDASTLRSPQGSVSAPPSSQSQSPGASPSARRTRALGPSLSAPVVGSKGVAESLVTQSPAHQRRTTEIAPAIMQRMGEPCPTCHGEGFIEPQTSRAAPSAVDPARSPSHRTGRSSSSLTGAHTWPDPSDGWSCDVPPPMAASGTRSRTISVADLDTSPRSSSIFSPSRSVRRQSPPSSSSSSYIMIPEPSRSYAQPPVASPRSSPIYSTPPSTATVTPRGRVSSIPASPVRPVSTSQRTCLRESSCWSPSSIPASPVRPVSNSSVLQSPRSSPSSQRGLSQRTINDVSRQVHDMGVQAPASDVGSPVSTSGVSSLGSPMFGLSALHGPSSEYNVPQDPRSPFSRNQRIPVSARSPPFSRPTPSMSARSAVLFGP